MAGTPNPYAKPRRGRSRRALLAEGLSFSGIDGLLRRLPTWRGALVLTYHRIGDPRRSELHRGVFTATADLLHRQLQLLQRHFDVVSPRELSNELLRARGRHVIVTFDDGYRDVYEAAYPVLVANGVRALMFLCSGFIDGSASAWWDEIAWMLRRAATDELPPGPWSPDALPLRGPGVEHAIGLATTAYWELEPVQAAGFLDRLASITAAGRRPTSAADWVTWEMAREMKAAGHEIGAHTATHPVLSRLPRDGQRHEIVASLDQIEAQLGERPRCLAYPIGTAASFDSTTVEVAGEAGLEFAFSNYGGRLTPRNFEPLNVNRVQIDSLRSLRLFSATLALPQLFTPGSRFS